MKRVATFFAGLLALGLAMAAVVGSAGAAGVDTGPNGEKAVTTFSFDAQKGSLLQSRPTPANWNLHGVVWEPEGQLGDQILPLRAIQVKMPAGVTFNPGKTKPCPDSKINGKTNLDLPPQTVIAKCPRSVIGNGTAYLQISHVINASELKDPVLVVFDAGRVAKGPQKGQARIKIYGMSKSTGHGVYMDGVLQKNGILHINVPWLTANAAVTMLDLDIPGSTPIKYDNRTVLESVGQDKNYLRATCPASGELRMESSYLLGEQLEDGTPIGDETLLNAPLATQSCTGKADAWVTKATVKGPARAKRGKKVTYRVRVTNAGSATAKGVKVTAKGKGAKGSAKAGNIPAGKSKTVRVKVKFTRKGKSKVTFHAKSRNGGSAKSVKRVRVK